MALAFERFNEKEGSVTTKQKKKAKVPVDHEKMAAGYAEMASINTEEAGMSEYSWNDGFKFYNDNPNAPW